MLCSVLLEQVHLLENVTADRATQRSLLLLLHHGGTKVLLVLLQQRRRNFLVAVLACNLMVVSLRQHFGGGLLTVAGMWALWWAS